MSSEPVWRIITDIAEARDTILKRRSLRDYALPDHVIERSVALFGERIMPEEAVRRIISSVRQGGDRALHTWNQKLDGAKPTPSGFRPPTCKPRFKRSRPNCAAR